MSTPRRFAHNVERWNRTSLSGYLVCAAAGEGALLTSQEKVQVWEQVAATAKSGAILLAATGAESVRETVQLSDRAAEIGYSAVVVAPPRRATVAARRSEAHRVYYQAVADAIRLPVIVENVAHGGDSCLSPETLRVLARHPNIAAVCDGSGAAGACSSSVDRASREVQTLAGDACLLAPSLEAGVLGAILDFASAAPFLCLSAEEAVRTRQRAAAAELQERITSAATGTFHPVRHRGPQVCPGRSRLLRRPPGFQGCHSAPRKENRLKISSERSQVRGEFERRANWSS